MLKCVEHNPKPEPETTQRESAHPGARHSPTVDVVIIDVDVVVIVVDVGGVVVNELGLVVVPEQDVPDLGLL